MLVDGHSGRSPGAKATHYIMKMNMGEVEGVAAKAVGRRRGFPEVRGAAL